ncbi:DeoR/GlpR family DNA-binding transcription regulator [Vagococcus vulneris]|uniref:DeoR family transcriptional regulator n=1 Tax=Vagococcus vulneris TaxID=1977869 RepID=A0A430A0J3_9ENTE|nr:DeoR/GlpR family DNA-binding transcription regulator [Vagococcus vulneris]RST99811.1 DeoR family transcriptional regulator [Vagococcus vulneris]
MKKSRHVVDNRHKKIINILQEHERLNTEELAEMLNVSLSTIRRDLNILEERNEIIRKHGYSIYNSTNTNYDESGPELLKKNIGRFVSTYIKDYNTVFINSSSTALNSVDFFTARHLTIVTNNLKIGTHISNNEYNYILTGGELRFPKEVLVGDIAVTTISSMNADVCIIGCSGISIENGVTTEVFHEAKINELMINRTTKTKILVADYRKMEQTSKFKISEIAVFDYLITDKFCPKTFIEEVRSLGVTVLQVD